MLFSCVSVHPTVCTQRDIYLLSNLVAILPLAYLILPHLAEEPLIIL